MISVSSMCIYQFLQSHGGTWRKWLKMPNGQAILAINSFFTTPRISSHSTTQIIQQFKSLPDFLMFPTFLASSHACSITTLSSHWDYPCHECICDLHGWSKATKSISFWHSHLVPRMGRLSLPSSESIGQDTRPSIHSFLESLSFILAWNAVMFVRATVLSRCTFQGPDTCETGKSLSNSLRYSLPNLSIGRTNERNLMRDLVATRRFAWM